MHVAGQVAKLRTVDRLLMCWFAFSGLTHIILEGYFVFTPDFFTFTKPHLLAEVCKSLTSHILSHFAESAVFFFVLLCFADGNLMAAQGRSTARLILATLVVTPPSWWWRASPLFLLALPVFLQCMLPCLSCQYAITPNKLYFLLKNIYTLHSLDDMKDKTHGLKHSSCLSYK